MDPDPRGPKTCGSGTLINSDGLYDKGRIRKIDWPNSSVVRRASTSPSQKSRSLTAAMKVRCLLASFSFMDFSLVFWVSSSHCSAMLSSRFCTASSLPVHLLLSRKRRIVKSRTQTRHSKYSQRWNSWTAFLVKVIGHKLGSFLKSFQTRVFVWLYSWIYSSFLVSRIFFMYF